jgi:diguanylate cyclase (GGDEF)-like protein
MDWDGVIVDGTGTIVARNHLMEKFGGTKAAPAVLAGMAEIGEGSMETKSVEGSPVLAVFSRSAVSSWGAGIEIPMQTLTNKLVHTLWWLVAGTALLLSGSLAFAWVIGGRIAGSIHKLAAPALALGSGEAVIVPSLHLREADEVGRALTRASEMLIAAQHRANHDALTGLANRSLFDEILGRQLAICERTKANLAVLYIDLDGFKSVNDAHGHAVGDEVLRTVAKRIVDAVRKSDVAARPGGDEFAVILIHAGLEAAKGVAAKLIDSLSIPYSVGALTLQISASIGIAAYPDSGATGEVLSRRADEAMYKAKAAGKRCYAVAA